MKPNKRIGAFLEPIRSAVRRKPFLVVDIESKDGDTQEPGFTRPFMVGVYDGDTFYDFRNEAHLASRPWQERHLLPGGCVDKFLTLVLSPRYSNHHIYAHNGGNFDHLFWLAWLARRHEEFGMEVVPVQSSIQKISVWRKPLEDEPVRERWDFVDSMKLLPMGLDKAAKSFGLTGKMSMDLSLHESHPMWGPYNEIDCKKLFEVLVLTHELIENKLGGEVGLTTPASSMKLFRRKYLKEKLPRFQHWKGCSDDACRGCAHEWIRKGYYGGRTEVYRTRGEGLHYYDINSSYVAAMREGMPVGTREVVEGELDWDRLENSVGFADVTVTIPKSCAIPPLPYRSGKLIFPSGTFRGVYDVDELRLLTDPLVGGAIEDVGRVVWFRKKPVFRDMVTDLWQLRDQTLPGYDEGLSLLAKLMGNALYGKFGMKQERMQIVRRLPYREGHCILCGEEAEVDVLCKECEGSKPASGDPESAVWYQKRFTDANYIIPQVSAHVTALARIRIWRYMAEALHAGGKLFYTDTDSIITDAVLPSSKALGELKDEYPGKTLRGTFVQPKVYMIEAEGWDKAKVTMKGFPSRERTKENLALLRAGGTIGFTQLEKVRSLAQEQFLNPPKMREVKKSFKGAYDKRVLHEDGTTSNIHLLPCQVPGCRDGATFTVTGPHGYRKRTCKSCMEDLVMGNDAAHKLKAVRER